MVHIYDSQKSLVRFLRVDKESFTTMHPTSR